MRYLIFILLLASFAYSQIPPPTEPGVSQDLAKWRAARYSDIRYKLNLTLEKMSPVIKGTIEITVKVGESALSEPPALAGGTNAGPIILDWRKITGHEKDSTISNVSINGNSVENHPVGEAPIPLLRKEGSFFFEESNDHLIFRDGVVAGENVIKLDFTSPILTSGSAITRYIDKEDGSEYIYSLFVPSDASTAFPVFDQPDLKARFSLRINVPREHTENQWHVVTNSKLMEGYGSVTDYFDPTTGAPLSPKYEAGFIFKETKPISTYVFGFAAGPFKEFVDGSPDRTDKLPKEWWTPARQQQYENHEQPRVLVRKSQSEKFKPHAAEVFHLTREGIKYLESYFDYKFPFPKLDLVLIPEFPFGGMEHAGAIFLREDRIIFPQEPTKNDYITRANVIFHETAHQWFGDTVTMKWFDDLWLKEGFAEFMAYKTMEKVMPEYDAWKVFYERNKQAAYLTDSTKGTTPIYQPIANLSAAKSAYGNIVYRKAPSFLRQAEFYLGEDKFQTAVRAFLKKHEFANATWEDLVKEFGTANSSNADLSWWARRWVTRPGLPRIFVDREDDAGGNLYEYGVLEHVPSDGLGWPERFNVLIQYSDGTIEIVRPPLPMPTVAVEPNPEHPFGVHQRPEKARLVNYLFPNYQDYGYGIFLLDDKSRDYILKNIQNEKDDFLRSMMWGALWDSVREAELDPKDYVELVIKVLGKSDAFTRDKSVTPKGVTPTGDKAITPKGVTPTGETDETTIATLLSRASTALSYYMPADAERVSSSPSVSSPHVSKGQVGRKGAGPSVTLGLRTRFEELLLDKLQHAATPGQRITYYRAYVNIASTPKAHEVLKQMLVQAGGGNRSEPAAVATGSLHTKDKFEIVTRLIILGDPEAPKLLANLEKTETSDEAKRYAYAARAAFATAENKAKYWNDFVNNKDISESWIEAAIPTFNSLKQADLTLPYLERSLAELPNLKRTRKIFFVNNWLSAFISGQRSEEALSAVNKFLAANPNLDNDLRLKILENVDFIERAVRIRAKYPK